MSEASGSGSRSPQTLADFAVIADGLREVLMRSQVRMRSLDRQQGWYSGTVSTWLRGVTALPAQRFFEILAALSIGTHEFFRIVYPKAEIPEKSNKEDFEVRDGIENLTTCLRLHLRHAIRSRGRMQSEIERKVGWTPRYLSTVLAGRRPLSLLHCLAVIRAIDLTPAEFFLSLDCERSRGESKKTDDEDRTLAKP